MSFHFILTSLARANNCNFEWINGKGIRVWDTDGEIITCDPEELNAWLGYQNDCY